jgi:hypothetical protein
LDIRSGQVALFYSGHSCPERGSLLAANIENIRKKGCWPKRVPMQLRYMCIASRPRHATHQPKSGRLLVPCNTVRKVDKGAVPCCYVVIICSNMHRSTFCEDNQSSSRLHAGWLPSHCLCTCICVRSLKLSIAWLEAYSTSVAAELQSWCCRCCATCHS